MTITVALQNLYGKEYYTPRLALKAVKFMISIHCNSQHRGCTCRTLKMLHLRQPFHFKYGIDPFQKGLLHSIPTYPYLSKLGCFLQRLVLTRPKTFVRCSSMLTKACRDIPGAVILRSSYVLNKSTMYKVSKLAVAGQ